MDYEGIEDIEGLVSAFEKVRSAEDRADAYRSTSLSGDERGQFVRYLSERPNFGVCATLTESVIGSLVERNCEEREFYAKLASFVFDGDLLSKEGAESVVAFGLSMIDRRLPYRHYDVTSMDNERFVQVSEAWMGEVEEVRRIARRPFIQKTEEASAVLDVIEGLEDHDVRCVLLAHYIDELRAASDTSAEE